MIRTVCSAVVMVAAAGLGSGCTTDEPSPPPPAGLDCPSGYQQREVLFTDPNGQRLRGVGCVQRPAPPPSTWTPEPTDNRPVPLPPTSAPAPPSQ